MGGEFSSLVYYYVYASRVCFGLMVVFSELPPLLVRLKPANCLRSGMVIIRLLLALYFLKTIHF